MIFLDEHQYLRKKRNDLVKSNKIHPQPITYHMVPLERLLIPELLSENNRFFTSSQQSSELESLVIATIHSLDKQAEEVVAAQFVIDRYEQCFTYNY
jgi:hypothetical protein